jgi:hypothetical protein
MSDAATPGEQSGWIEAIGLRHLLRTLPIALHTPKMTLALSAIIVTFIWGGFLDTIWTHNGGVDRTAITAYIAACETDAEYVEPEGKLGIFDVWREHERRSILGLMGSSLPIASVAHGTPVGTYVQTHSYNRPLRNLVGMAYGVVWMMIYHPIFFVFFNAGALLIWSFFGGAICRIAAIHFALDEILTARQGRRYAWKNLFNGFFFAPCVPIAFILVAMIVLVGIGLFLAIPVFGDLFGGVLFFVAILVGFIIAVLGLGLLVGGNLFWPAVAMEGLDAYDGFNRALAYPLSRPLKATAYAVIMLVFASVCWVFVNLFTFFALKVTRAVVGFGTSPFGWWKTGEGDATMSKMERLWPLGGPNALYAWPDWSTLAWYEHISGFFIGVYVLIVIGLMWSFLASFYFSGSTIIYALLRRDVDGIELDAVHLDDQLPVDAFSSTEGS